MNEAIIGMGGLYQVPYPPPSLHLLKEIFLSSSLGIRGAHSLSPGQEISDKAEEKKRGKDLEICSRIGLWQIELSDW